MGNSRKAATLSLSLADDADREAIYQSRHDVYARELRQRPENDDRRLTDDLDARNIYIVAKTDGALAGYVSLTPPSPDGAARFSIDKYVSRADLPFAVDDSVYEIRLLTVTAPFRAAARPIAPALMYAALRLVESRDGRRIVAIGRDEILGLYRKIGLRPLGLRFPSGAVTFEAMTATPDDLRAAPAFDVRVDMLERAVDWRLPCAFRRPPACYHGGDFFNAIGDGFDDLSRRDRIVAADVLDAWFPPAPGVLDALRTSLDWLLRTSPPTDASGLRRAIARARAVPAGCVLPGAGSSDLIFLALRALITPASRALILDPMYGEYAHILERVIGCRVDRLHLDPARAFAVDTAELEARLATGYDLVALVNPNSPTGRHLPRAALEPVLARAPRSTLFWIDETYTDYAGPDESLERSAAASHNVIVCKSMSKAYALSGVRAAYLVGPAGLVERLRPLAPPWSVGLPAQLAAVRALEDPAYYRARWSETHALRADLADRLRTLPSLRVHDGVANFLLCELGDGAPPAARVVEACRADGVYIRDASTMGRSLARRWIRVAVRDAASNARIVDSITRAVAHTPTSAAITPPAPAPTDRAQRPPAAARRSAPSRAAAS